MQIDESDEQCAKAESPIKESLQADSNVTVERELHPEKQPAEIAPTKHGSNAYSPINKTAGLDSNMILEREWHPEKQRSQGFLRDEGLQIDESDEHCDNAQSPINESSELGLTVTLRRAVHLRKQEAERFPTDGGTQIDESDEPCKNAESPTTSPQIANLREAAGCNGPLSLFQSCFQAESKIDHAAAIA
jgi:hypothetical protein